MEPILESFFNGAFLLGEQLPLPAAAWDDRKEMVNIAKKLTALTTLEAIHRTHVSKLQPDQLLLASGKVVSMSELMQQHLSEQHVKVCRALGQLKRVFTSAPLSPAQLEHCRRRLLQERDRQDVKQQQQPEEDKQEAAVVAAVLDVVEQIVPLGIYQNQFVKETMSVLRSMKRTPQPEKQKQQPDDTVEAIWQSFLNHSYDLLHDAIYNLQWITVEECEENSAFLYVGSTKLGLLDAILRSSKLENAILLASGQVVKLVQQSSGAPHLAIMNQLLAAKQLCFKYDFSPQEAVEMRKLSLLSQAEHKEKELATVQQLSVERMRQINDVLAITDSIATQVSQMKVYRECFNTVLMLLAKSSTK